MICHIIREKTSLKQVRHYKTTVIISKKTVNRINRIPGVVNLSLPSGNRIRVVINEASNWESNFIDQKVIRILQRNFVLTRRESDPNEEIKYVVEDIEDIYDLSKGPTFILSQKLSRLFRLLDGQNDQNEINFMSNLS